jgi:hypothetical protein
MILWPDSNCEGFSLQEVWSDAARAASAAARANRSKGYKSRREEAHRAFFSHKMPSALENSFTKGLADATAASRSHSRAVRKPSLKTAYRMGYNKPSTGQLSKGSAKIIAHYQKVLSTPNITRSQRRNAHKQIRMGPTGRGRKGFVNEWIANR